MEVTLENEEIMGKTAPQDLHDVMAEDLFSSAVPNFKISLGNSAGKLKRTLRRAGDISPQLFSQDLHDVMAEALASSAIPNYKICLGNSSGNLRTLRRSSSVGTKIHTRSKKPQFLAPDLHSMMAGALAASAGQNLKICSGSSSGKMQRPSSKSTRAGDISLLEAISSPVVAKIGLESPQNLAPDLHAVVAEALAASAGQNLKIYLGSSAGKALALSSKNLFAQQQIEASAKNITLNLQAVSAGATAAVDVDNINISLGTCLGQLRKVPTKSRFEMSGTTAPVNLSNDINSWKEASNSDSSLHQASKEC